MFFCNFASSTLRITTAPNATIWFAVAVSLVGLFLLSGTETDDLDIGFGESLVVVSTVFWTLHITYTDLATGQVNSLDMINLQVR